MSGGVDRLVQTILQAIKQEKKTKAYFTQAEVKKVDKDTAWVHIPNGVEMTPVKKTINCKKGDIVQVRVGDGTATITGNGTSPPTDDTRAIKADVKAASATKKAVKAQETADGADKRIKNLNQYFWAKEGSSSEAGAHVTEVPQNDFEDNPTGGNMLLKSAGLYLRDGLVNLLQILQNTIIVGPENRLHMEITGVAIRFKRALDTILEIVWNNVDGYAEITRTYRWSSSEWGYSSIQFWHRGLSLLAGYNDAEEGQTDAEIELVGDGSINIKSDVVKFNSKAPFTTYTATGTGTISANGDTSITFTGTLPTGYTPLALSRINVETHQSDVATVEWYLNVPAGNGTVRLRNLTNSSISVDISVVVLCTSIQ